MARKKRVVPTVVQPVEPYLIGVAKSLVDRIDGPDGLPWVPKLEELVDTVDAVRKLLSEKMLAQRSNICRTMSRSFEQAIKRTGVPKSAYREHALRAHCDLYIFYPHWIACQQQMPRENALVRARRTDILVIPCKKI